MPSPACQDSDVRVAQSLCLGIGREESSRRRFLIVGKGEGNRNSTKKPAGSLVDRGRRHDSHIRQVAVL